MFPTILSDLSFLYHCQRSRLQRDFTHKEYILKRLDYLNQILNSTVRKVIESLAPVFLSNNHISDLKGIGSKEVCVHGRFLFLV
jgi:hypothetical protein